MSVTAPFVEESVTGIVSDIQRFSLHDGPGIRTTVFLKGCSMRCRWCHNPETFRRHAELQVNPDKCIGCGACVTICPSGACTKEEFHRELCTSCGLCAEECYSGALKLVGREMHAADVRDEVTLDVAFYAESGGGVTLSGGEPLDQRRFACEILRLCRNAGIHTAIETNLARPWKDIASALQLLDL
ncbi:MAG: glycyl-radical enzyme activating protein, partial [Dehalococcoidia bacterium]|nr:glycyl-radical enzyme activating protein [Dehalococcoidia bacterium]